MPSILWRRSHGFSFNCHRYAFYCRSIRLASARATFLSIIEKRLYFLGAGIYSEVVKLDVNGIVVIDPHHPYVEVADIQAHLKLEN